MVAGDVRGGGRRDQRDDERDGDEGDKEDAASTGWELATDDPVLLASSAFLSFQSHAFSSGNPASFHPQCLFVYFSGRGKGAG